MDLSFAWPRHILPTLASDALDIMMRNGKPSQNCRQVSAMIKVSHVNLQVTFDHIRCHYFSSETPQLRFILESISYPGEITQAFVRVPYKPPN